ncbi:MAG TPA: hypothetical protein VK181_18975 [Rhizobium sp.]|nr:hypothetical protein [Rhizobium sp.]
MNEKINAAAIRTQAGRLEVTVPEELLVAGQENSISFVLRNPYSSSITVREVIGPSSQSITSISKTKPGNANGNDESFVSGFRAALPLVFASISAPFGVQIETSTKFDRTVNVTARPNSLIKFDEDIGPYTTLNIEADEGSKVEIGKKVTDTPSEPGPVIIPPGSERIFTVFVRTNHWLLFTPQRFLMNIQLGFELDGEFKSQVVSASFSINPPLISILCGAVLGGGLGALARALQTPSDLSLLSLVQGAGAIVMSIIASITLSRKTGAQSFITVEDFFGAFAIGALIGYGGSEYFRRAILPGASDQPVNASG